MLSAEYAARMVEGFVGLFSSFGSGGAEAFQTFLDSPALPASLITVAVVWLLRRRRR